MTNVLSKSAQEFLRGDHVAVVGTLNRDGSPHLTTVWYLLANDGTLILSTPSGTRKAKNLLHDRRIGLCVGDGARSISLYGTVSIHDDQAVIRQDRDRLVERYVKEESARPQVIKALAQQPRVALHFKPEKVTEFSV